MSDEKTSFPLPVTDDFAPTAGRLPSSESAEEEPPTAPIQRSDFCATSDRASDCAAILAPATIRWDSESGRDRITGINSNRIGTASLSLPQSMGRTIAMLLLLGPAYFFCFWLVLTCADFFDVERIGRGLTRPWTDFAARISFAILLPPAIIAAFDARRPVLLRLREAARASLITFLCFAALFFAVGALIVRFSSGMNIGLIPELLLRTAPLASCMLLYVSYKLAEAMLPLPIQTIPPPRPVRHYRLLAAFLILTLPIQALAPLAPFGLPPLPIHFYDVRALPQDLFLFISVAWLLHHKGLRTFRPIWVACCLFGPLLLLLGLTSYPLPWQIFHLIRAVVAVLSCACLYTPRARHWLVA